MTKNITVSVSDMLASKMETLPEINWSEVCRQSISKYIEKRSVEKGELLKELEEFWKTRMLPDKESIKKAEIERFTKRWGPPEVISERAQAPYVQLRRIQTVQSEDTVFGTFKVFNDVLLNCTPIADEKRTKLLEFHVEKWKRDLIKQAVVDYFKAKGFKVGECKLIPALIETYVFDGNKGAAKEFMGMASKDVWGLFAFDSKDIVFLAYREEK